MFSIRNIQNNTWFINNIHLPHKKLISSQNEVLKMFNESSLNVRYVNCYEFLIIVNKMLIKNVLQCNKIFELISDVTVRENVIFI